MKGLCGPRGHLHSAGLCSRLVAELHQGHQHGQTQTSDQNVEDPSYVAEAKSTGLILQEEKEQWGHFSVMTVRQRHSCAHTYTFISIQRNTLHSYMPEPTMLNKIKDVLLNILKAIKNLISLIIISHLNEKIWHHLLMLFKLVYKYIGSRSRFSCKQSLCIFKCYQKYLDYLGKFISLILIKFTC